MLCTGVTAEPAAGSSPKDSNACPPCSAALHAPQIWTISNYRSSQEGVAVRLSGSTLR